MGDTILSFFLIKNIRNILHQNQETLSISLEHKMKHALISIFAALAVACLMATPVQGQDSDCVTYCTNIGAPKQATCEKEKGLSAGCYNTAFNEGMECYKKCVNDKKPSS